MADSVSTEKTGCFKLIKGGQEIEVPWQMSPDGYISFWCNHKDKDKQFPEKVEAARRAGFDNLSWRACDMVCLGDSVLVAKEALVTYRYLCRTPDGQFWAESHSGTIGHYTKRKNLTLGDAELVYSCADHRYLTREDAGLPLQKYQEKLKRPE